MLMVVVLPFSSECALTLALYVYDLNASLLVVGRVVHVAVQIQICILFLLFWVSVPRGDSKNPHHVFARDCVSKK